MQSCTYFLNPRNNLVCLISLILVFSFTTSAQSAAEKSWKPFWKQFSAAVKSKNKAAVKRLMSSEKDFMCCQEEGETTRDEWLKDLDKSKSWGYLQKQVAKGTKPYYNNDPRRPVRTSEGFLLFAFIGGKWRFVGEAFLE